jgi:hypothetical protein
MTHFRRRVPLTVVARKHGAAFEIPHLVEVNIVNRRKLGVASILLLIIATPAWTQTIPQLLAKEGHSLGRSVEVETGPPPSVESVLRKTDLIVQGFIGTSKAYLSNDQTDVYTEYSIERFTVLYPSSAAPVGSRPGQPTSITFTQPGGIVTINGLTFSVSHKELPPLTPGIECVFLLRREGATYRIVGTYYGIFGLDGESLSPMAKTGGFADSLRRLKAADAVVRLVSARKALP